MKVKMYLELIGSKPLGYAHPEGSMVLDLINTYSLNQYEISTLSGDEATSLIHEFQEDQRNAVLESELNDGVDFLKYRKDVEELVKNGSGTTTRLIIATMMTILVVAASLSFLCAMLFVAYHKKTIPGWEELALVFGVPGVVIWKYFGVLNKERTELILAAMGKTPIMNNPMVNAIREFRRPNPTSESKPYKRFED